MSNRAFLIFSALLILVVAGQIGILVYQPGLDSRASLEIHATNAGIPLASDDAQIFVYPRARLEQLAAKGRAFEAIHLPAGRYDVRVLYVRTSDQLARWLEDVTLDNSQDRIEQVDFQAGELSVQATVGSGAAEPGVAVVYVFRPEDHDRIVTSMEAGARVLLSAGLYDLRVVWTLDSEEKDVIWLDDIEVKADLHSLRSVAFDRGMLLLRASNGTEALPSKAVELTVYRAADPDKTIVERGLAGVPLGLTAGSYDVEAVFAESNDRPSRWLEDLAIESGRTSELTVAFSSGTAMVDAGLEGGARLEGYQVYVYFYSAGNHEQPVTYAPAGEPVVLESGHYDVRASFFRSHDQPDIWLRDLVLEPGQTITETVTFPSGRLLVRAYDGAGAELLGDNVFVYVYAEGERTSPLATARSGEILVLQKGVYDIRAQDTRRACNLWLEAVELQTGPLQERSVTFPSDTTQPCAAQALR
jgi:hypothetical protein